MLNIKSSQVPERHEECLPPATGPARVSAAARGLLDRVRGATRRSGPQLRERRHVVAAATRGRAPPHAGGSTLRVASNQGG